MKFLAMYKLKQIPVTSVIYLLAERYLPTRKHGHITQQPRAAISDRIQRKGGHCFERLAVEGIHRAPADG